MACITALFLFGEGGSGRGTPYPVAIRYCDDLCGEIQM